MSYIEHSLGRSEKLLYRAHFPWFYHAGAWGLLLASALGAVAAYGNGYGELGGVAVLGGLGLFFAIMVPIWTTEIGVTNQRFILKRGLILRKTQELQLRAIEEVNFDQGVLGRLFRFGRLELRGTGVDNIHLPALADPVGLRRALQDGMSAAGQAITAGSPAAAQLTAA